jgi:hypothetical protein
MEDFMKNAKKAPTRATTEKRAHGKISAKRKPAQAQAAAKGDASASPAKGKLASVIALLRRPKGANLAELCKATGWQAHSVRGAMSGAIKKKLGLKVTSEKSEGVRTYRIAS